jgi:iron complex transport system ATP-binding protein
MRVASGWRVSHLLLVGVELERPNGALVIRCTEPLQILSTAVLGGGRRSARTIVTLRVEKDYAHRRPEHDIRAFAKARSLAAPVVGLMTTAELADARVQQFIRGEVRVGALITVDLDNTLRAGDVAIPPRAGTINGIFVIEGRLHEAAAVELVQVAAEAKANALAEAGVRTADGHLASGTTTDAIVVGWRRRGRPIRYAGTTTPLGTAVANLMREAVARAASA